MVTLSPFLTVFLTFASTRRWREGWPSRFTVPVARSATGVGDGVGVAVGSGVGEGVGVAVGSGVGVGVLVRIIGRGVPVGCGSAVGADVAMTGAAVF